MVCDQREIYDEFNFFRMINGNDVEKLNKNRQVKNGEKVYA